MKDAPVSKTLTALSEAFFQLQQEISSVDKDLADERAARRRAEFKCEALHQGAAVVSLEAESLVRDKEQALDRILQVEECLKNDAIRIAELEKQLAAEREDKQRGLDLILQLTAQLREKDAELGGLKRKLAGLTEEYRQYRETFRCQAVEPSESKAGPKPFFTDKEIRYDLFRRTFAIFIANGEAEINAAKASISAANTGISYWYADNPEEKA